MNQKIYCLLSDEGQPLLYWQSPVPGITGEPKKLSPSKASEWGWKIHEAQEKMRLREPNIHPSRLHIDMGDLLSLPGKPFLLLDLFECLWLANQLMTVGVAASSLDLGMDEFWTTATPMSVRGGDGCDAMSGLRIRIAN